MARPDVDALFEDLRIDDVLLIVTPQEVAETWMRYQRGQQESDRWADWLWMEKEWWADEGRVRDGILRLVDLAVSDEDYSDIAASILEDFATDDESRLDWIERQAAASARFRLTMRDMWVWRLPDEAFRRVERAAGVELADPDADQRRRRMDEQ